MENRLKELLALRDMSVSELSRRTGIPQPTLHRIVNAQVNIDGITASNFIRIAHGLGLSAEQLCYGDISYDRDKREIDRIYATTCKEGRKAMLANARGIDASYPRYDTAALPTIRDDISAVTGF